MDTTLRTASLPLLKFSANGLVVPGSFATLVPQAADPADTFDGVITSDHAGLNIGSYGRLYIIGQGALNDPFSAKLKGWSALQDATTKLWIPSTVGSVTGTLGAAVGVDGTPVDSSWRIAATLVVVVADGEFVTLPADGGIQIAKFDQLGFQRLQFQPGPGMATKLNAVLARF